MDNLGGYIIGVIILGVVLAVVAFYIASGLSILLSPLIGG